MSYLLQAWHLHGAELEAVEGAAGLQDAEGLAQRRIAVSDVPNAEGNRVGVERIVRVRERLRKAGVGVEGCCDGGRGSWRWMATKSSSMIVDSALIRIIFSMRVLLLRFRKPSRVSRSASVGLGRSPRPPSASTR